MGGTRGSRPGRPPASSSADTRQRIIEVATELFSDLGYGVTTNKDVAVRAGISTGALYYYFESKLDMYMAVFRELQTRIDDRMSEVMRTEDSFHARLVGILRAAKELTREDPYIARFQGTARVDRERHPELKAAIAHSPGEGSSVMARLIGEGVERGEIPAAHRDLTEAAVRVLFVGLVSTASADPAVHGQAVEGLCALLDGTLLPLPPGRRGAGGRAGARPTTATVTAGRAGS
jgi:AcrR family transcriptional regulator